ncbi:MAG: helix-turn-helix transcriptional regulator [Dongiaceae bacterium]
MIDRRETVAIFRARLAEVIARSGDSRAAFAQRLGIDRSTLAQILSPANDRLPRAETLAAIAASEQVSVDWLLGLSQGGPLTAAIMPQPLEIEPGAGSPADERLTRWHAEAAGYKVRYVPATLPDLLKSEELIRYEYREYAEPIPESRIEAASARLATQRRPETDMEVCSPRQGVESFARGEGIWRDLPAAARRRQLVRMIALVDELYPTFRWFLYDGAKRYSVPLTVFGPKRAAIYVGHLYLVFNSTEHIRMLTANFDDLIRAAVMQPPDVPGFLRSLLDELDRGQGGARRARRDD